jgi:hypothetical protein
MMNVRLLPNSQDLAQGHGAYLFEQDEASNDIFIVSVEAYAILFLANTLFNL